MSTTKSTRWRSTLAASALLACLPLPALAHHVMDGQTPVTWWQGLLSGLAHPLFGIDHFLFLVALGLLSFGVRGAWRPAMSFMIGVSIGVLIHVYGLSLPAGEVLVALTLGIAGAALALHYQGRGRVLMTALALAGVLHGYAFGESIAGADQVVIGSYLLGLAIMQAVVCGLVVAAARHLESRSRDMAPGAVRFMGAVIGAAGLVLMGIAV